MRSTKIVGTGHNSRSKNKRIHKVFVLIVLPAHIHTFSKTSRKKTDIRWKKIEYEWNQSMRNQIGLRKWKKSRVIFLIKLNPIVLSKWCECYEKHRRIAFKIDPNFQCFIFDETRSENVLRQLHSNKVCDKGIWDKNTFLGRSNMFAKRATKHNIFIDSRMQLIRIAFRERETHKPNK